MSSFVILGLQKSAWKVELDGAKQIKNAGGYIATDYIDNSPDLQRYCLQTSTRRSDGTPAFTVFLNYFNARGEIEGSSTEISWNTMVRRYQEFRDVEGFLRARSRWVLVDHNFLRRFTPTFTHSAVARSHPLCYPEADLKEPECVCARFFG